MTLTPDTRFVIITQDYHPDIGGITTWVYEFGRHLRQGGHEVLVVTKSFDGFSGEEPSDLPTVRLDHNGWRHKKYSRIRSAIRPMNDGRTVFLCANWKMAVPCMILSLFSRIPYFVAVFGLDALEGRFKNRLLQSYTMWRASGIMPISRYTKNLLAMPRLKRSGRVHIVPTGVDTTRFEQRPRKAAIERKYGLQTGVRILNVGRLIERKGFDTTIRAMTLVNDKKTHFYIGGKGPYESELRTLARQSGVADRVHFLGFIEEVDLVDLYNAVDVFCMPSRELPYQVEGYGITYLEAAACGVPSIGGLNSGAEDAIIANETGLLVDANSPEAVADALQKLISDESLRKKLGEQARLRVQRELTWTAAIAQFLQIVKKS